MKRFLSIGLCLFVAVTTVVHAANISFVLSNSVSGTSDTNWFLLTPVSTPLANGQFMLTGVPIRVYPGTGIILTNLQPGNYCASNKFLATSFASPYGSGTPLGVFFAVPNDPSTNVYSFCGPGSLISGANTYNYTPGVNFISGTNGLSVYPGKYPGMFVIDGSGISGGGIVTAQRYLDATNGSDSYNGSQSYPWATIAHAQTNTPAGATLNVAAGTYGQAATNGLVNWNLAYGANVGFDLFNCTNAIYGNGNVTKPVDWTNVTVNIHCSLFKLGTEGFWGACAVTNTSDLVDFNLSGLQSYTNSTGTNIIFWSHSRNVLNVSSMTAGAGGSIAVYLFADQEIDLNQLDGNNNIAAGSIISAPVCVVGGNSLYFTKPIVWVVGSSTLAYGGTAAQFAAGTTFVGNPQFDGTFQTFTAPSSLGVYTWNGTLYGALYGAAPSSINYPGPPTNYPPYLQSIIVDSNSQQWMYSGGSWH